MARCEKAHALSPDGRDQTDPFYIYLPNRLTQWGRYVLLMFVVHGCAAPIFDMPQPLPPVVRQYRHVYIYADSPHYRSANLFLEQGDLYSILVQGKVRTQRAGPTSQQRRLLMRIGNHRVWSVPRNQTRKAEFSGKVSFMIRDGPIDVSGRPQHPEYYQDNAGILSIEVIVWASDDYRQITEFLKQMHEKHPEKFELLVAYNDIKFSGKVYLAEKQTRQEIAETQQALVDIKEKAVAAGEKSTGDPRVQALEAKLDQLTAKLAELNRMKRQLAQAQQKTSQLSRKLEEKQKREQLLLGKLSEGVKSPPLLLITAPADGYVTEAKRVRLRGAAEDDRGLQRLEIHLNGRRLPDAPGRGVRLVDGQALRRLEFDRHIALQKGTNRIRVHVIDSDGLFTEKILSVARIARRRNLWAVVVGIDAYPRLRKLKYAVSDARAFYDWLVTVNQVPQQNVTLLLDGQATLKRLRSALGTQLKNVAGKDDLVIIFFAGHGAVERDTLSADGDGLEKYLLPYDTDPDDLYATALPMREIAHIFNRIRSERLIFLADACYSGASGGRTISVTGLRASLSDAFLARLARGKGKIIITASGANEVSQEKDDLRHGVFTYYLLEGLRGGADSDGDGIITVDEAYGYVSQAVPKATDQEQHPVKKGTVEGQLLLGIVP